METTKDEAKTSVTEVLPSVATRVQVAAYAQISVPTLARWAGEGRGPKFVRLGPGNGAIRYRREDVLAWLESSDWPTNEPQPRVAASR